MDLSSPAGLSSLWLHSLRLSFSALEPGRVLFVGHHSENSPALVVKSAQANAVLTRSFRCPSVFLGVTVTG